MLNRHPFPASSSLMADVLVVLGVGAVIFGLSLFAGEWNTALNPTFEIDLRPSALPMYALFSALRGLVAYVLSLAFTIVIGYWAAYSKPAERIILPLLDILQSIPVLGFLPGLVLGLVALFPHSNTGLELAAILMIFTGQVWNMTFAFYSSLKSIPGDLQEASSVMGLSGLTKLLRLELPFSAVNLVWNSIMSMAGGWFFLTVCEAFTLGNQDYRLPGVGAYMAVAIEKGDTRAMVLGVCAMAAVILALDTLIWRPALAWVHRYRIEETISAGGDDKLLEFILVNSSFVRFLRRLLTNRNRRLMFRPPKKQTTWKLRLPALNGARFFKFMRLPFTFLVLAGLISGCVRLVVALSALSGGQWLQIVTETFFTFMRVISCVVIATIWAVPAGIWLSRSERRLRIAQPLAQLMASFPAPMLYPLVIGMLLGLRLDFSIGSMLLMLLGVQWYILFNTLAGGLRIPKELSYVMDLHGNRRREKWRFLYLPSVFPSLVTGWVTAAGGAWNASIVAEYVAYKGQIIEARGLGALISRSAANGDFTMLSACLVVMVVLVVLLNRVVWDRIYKIAQTRFRLDF